MQIESSVLLSLSQYGDIVLSAAEAVIKKILSKALPSFYLCGRFGYP